MLTHRRLPTPPCLMRSRIALIRGARGSPLQQACIYGASIELTRGIRLLGIVRRCDFRASMSRVAMSRQIPVRSFEDSRT